MKLAILGFIFIIISVGFAGNWIYNPFAEPQAELDPYEPIVFYPEDDPADEVYHSNLTFIPSLNMSYIEYNYVWLNATGHTPDTEQVRIYIQNGTVHHISLLIHYEWMNIYNFTSDGTHVHIRFTPVFHTPYTSTSALFSTSLKRIVPIAIPLTIGLLLIYADYKLVEFSARAKVAKGMTKYSIRAKWNMIFGKNK
jgi:hypothetical protein